MRPALSRSFALLLLISFAALFQAGSLRAAPPEEIVGVPQLGPAGVGETLSQIMARQAALEAAGVARRLDRDNEEKTEKPDRSNLAENPDSPDISRFPESAITLGQSAEQGGPALTPQVVGTSFTGATLSGINPTLSFPPDCMGAVGPTQYIVFVNGRLVTFNKTTGTADGVLNADPDVFFGSVVNGSYTSDPRIRYDRLTGRWFLVIINVSTPNRILIAVSDAANAGAITGGTVFTFFYIAIDTTPPTISNTCLADYPTLGLDANALYIGTNNFCGSPFQSFNGSDGYVVRKSSIMGAGPMVVTAFRGLVPNASSAGPYTPQGVDNFDPSATEGYFIGVDNLAYGKLQMRRVSDPGGTPSISANISITVPTTAAPLLVPHLGNTGGTSGRLDGLDDRLFAAHIRNGRLWTAHNIGVNNTGVASGTRTRNASRWYELDVPAGSGTPTVVQSGTVYTASASNTTDQRHYWIPSMMVSGQGHVAMGFSAAGTNEYANAATVGRLSGTTLGTMGTPELYTSSSTAYNPPSDPGGSGGRRWGDYSYTSLDPLDDMTMWTVQEFCDATNSYGVRVAKLIAPPPATPSVLADVTAGQSSVAVTLTGTVVSGSGFYDPGANLPGVPAFSHLSASATNGSATGTPPTVVSATYVNPTTVDLVLNTSAATANLPGEKYTITVTNPDGQTASAAVLRVVGGTPSATIAAGPSLNEGDAGATPFEFVVNLSAPSALPVTVYYTTGDDSATVADADYQAATDSLVIAAGATADTITVNVNGDLKHELDETFTVTLTGAANAVLGATVVATGTIQNDDAAPTVSIDDVQLSEGDAGTTSFDFTVSLSAPSGLAASVDFATADDSATLADSDYQQAIGTASFAAGETTQVVSVLVNGDITQESDETFFVNLSAPAGATLADSVGIGGIQNDDMIPSLSITGVSRAEGNSGTTAFVFAVSLSNPTNQTVSVLFHTADSTATTADNDYQAAGDTLFIPAAALADSIVVLVNGDPCGEPDEAFRVILSSPSGATIAVGTATGVITNDDDATAPAVTVDAPNGGEVVIVGDPLSIQWTATDSVGVTGVDILLSRDGGLTYPEVLASAIANTGSFNWNATGPDSPVPDAIIQVVAHDDGCNTGFDVSDAAFRIAANTTGLPTNGPITEFALGRIFPNPTTGATQIEFQLPREASVRVVVMDPQGRQVASLVDATLPAGRHLATWDGRASRGPAATGVYFIHYEGGGRAFTRRLVLTR